MRLSWTAYHSKDTQFGKEKPCIKKADEMLAETVPQTSDLQQVSYIQII
jgi:hypothetical protein